MRPYWPKLPFTAGESAGEQSETECAALLIGKRLREFEGLQDLGAEG